MVERVYDKAGVTIYHGEALAVLSELADASLDALVTDPPAGIAFMGKTWDAFGGGTAKDGRAEQEHYRDQYGKGASAYGHSHKSATPKAGEREAFIAAMTAVFVESLRVLKPGAHGLVWSLPRTSHWTATALEDAGFEIRDCIYHLFGTGFPKSRNVGKAIDKALGAERPVIGQASGARNGNGQNTAYGTFASAADGTYDVTAPATVAAEAYAGFGSALKPGAECWWLVRKPLGAPTIEANVLTYGTGALNIDACRIGTADTLSGSGSPPLQYGGTNQRPFHATAEPRGVNQHSAGRWPANVVLTHTIFCRQVGTHAVKGSRIEKPSTTGSMTSGYSGGLAGDRPARGIGDADGLESVEAWECSPECPVRLLDEQSGERTSGARDGRHIAKGGRYGGIYGAYESNDTGNQFGASTGGASRFFHTAQADDDTETEPDEVWECAPDCPVKLLDEQSGERPGGKPGQSSAPTTKHAYGAYATRSQVGHDDSGGASRFYYTAKASQRSRRGSKHPTVKSVALMRWLVRLVTPPGGTVLDCFAGSGATVEACLRERFGVVAIDREAEYVDDMLKRVGDYHVTPETALSGGRW